jgi:hypothetical protein
MRCHASRPLGQFGVRIRRAFGSRVHGLRGKEADLRVSATGVVRITASTGIIQGLVFRIWSGARRLGCFGPIKVDAEMRILDRPDAISTTDRR